MKNNNLEFEVLQGKNCSCRNLSMYYSRLTMGRQADELFTYDLREQIGMYKLSGLIQIYYAFIFAKKYGVQKSERNRDCMSSNL